MDRIIEQLQEISQKLDLKFDRIEIRLDSLEKLDAVQNEQLKNHMERTALAEENISLLRKEFEPVKQRVVLENTIARIGVAVLGASGGILAILKVFFKVF